MKEIDKELLLIAYLKRVNEEKFKQNPKLIYNNLVVALAFISSKNLESDYYDYVKKVSNKLKRKKKG
ncbi:MAG: hypothetical protein QXZ13_02465 [Candidatus Diapherotrites archaeon]